MKELERDVCQALKATTSPIRTPKLKSNLRIPTPGLLMQTLGGTTLSSGNWVIAISALTLHFTPSAHSSHNHAIIWTCGEWTNTWKHSLSLSLSFHPSLLKQTNKKNDWIKLETITANRFPNTVLWWFLVGSLTDIRGYVWWTPTSRISSPVGNHHMMAFIDCYGQIEAVFSSRLHTCGWMTDCRPCLPVLYLLSSDSMIRLLQKHTSNRGQGQTLWFQGRNKPIN